MCSVRSAQLWPLQRTDVLILLSNSCIEISVCSRGSDTFHHFTFGSYWRFSTLKHGGGPIQVAVTTATHLMEKKFTTAQRPQTSSHRHDFRQAMWHSKNELGEYSNFDKKIDNDLFDSEVKNTGIQRYNHQSVNQQLNKSAARVSFPWHVQLSRFLEDLHSVSRCGRVNCEAT